MRILILGGTTEAFALAERLDTHPQWDVTLSLAGRTADPKRANVPTRIGGFGGIEGLKGWLVTHKTDLVIDATHPFAAIISRNASEACGPLGLPLLAIRRPAWTRQPGDTWIEVETMQAAAISIGTEPRRAFLTVGRLELTHFAAAPQHHYLVRTIEPIGDALPVPHVTMLQARGPFNEEGERNLMLEHRIAVVVTKNSGGHATYGKIATARHLGLPVVIVSQPHKPAVEKTETVDEAMAWIERHGRGP